MAKLLLMTETHCKMKDNILDIFEDVLVLKKIHILKKKGRRKKFVTTFLNNENINKYKKEDRICIKN